MKLNKFLRWFVLVGIFIIPFISLIVLNSLFFPFITGKGFTFRIIVELIFGAWVIMAVTDPKYRPRRSWLLYAFAIFLVIIAVADMFGANPYKSFWSNFERMEGFITLLHLFAYFLVASTVLSTERLWNWFWNLSIVASLIEVVYGFLQLAGKITINQGGVRLDGTFGNATYLAIYMLFSIFITAYIVISPNLFLFIPSKAGNQKKITKLVVGIIIIILQFIILYYTATRGSLLGLIGGIGLAALLIALFERTRPRLRKVSIGVVVVAVVVVLGFLVVKNSSFVKKSPVLSRMASISLSDPTTESRFLLWKMAIQGFEQHPILGWGQENFNYVFNQYYNPKLYNQEQWFDRAHDIIFDWLTAGGILGLASYLFFYGAVIWYIWKPRNPNVMFSVSEKSVLIGMMVGYFIHNLFVFDNLISYIMFISVAAYVYSRTAAVPLPSAEPAAYKPNRVIAPMALIVTIALIWFLNAKPIMSNVDLIKALTPSSTTSLEPNIAEFKKVLSYNSFGTPEAREQILNTAENLLSTTNPTVDSQSQSDIENLAADQLKLQIAATPKDARYYVLLGSFLDEAQDYTDAIPYLKEGVELSPDKQVTLFELGSAYVGNQDYPDAFATFQRAYNLDTDYQDAKMLYAAAAIYDNQTSTAQTLLKSVPTDTIVADDNILRAYYTTGQYDEVLAMWKIRTSESENSAQAHVSLAAAYLLVNDRTDAIAEIKKAEALEPTFKTEGDTYIQEIQEGKNP